MAAPVPRRSIMSRECFIYIEFCCRKSRFPCPKSLLIRRFYRTVPSQIVGASRTVCKYASKRAAWAYAAASYRPPTSARITSISDTVSAVRDRGSLLFNHFVDGRVYAGGWKFFSRDPVAPMFLGLTPLLFVAYFAISCVIFIRPIHFSRSPRPFIT